MNLEQATTKLQIDLEEKNIASNILTVNQVVVHDTFENRWLQFVDPQEIVEAYSVDEVMEKLRYVERAVADRELYAAGMIAYEAAPAFDSKLAVRSGSGFPLVWFGLYEHPSEIILPRVLDGSQLSETEWTASVSPDEYLSAFEQIKSHIENGRSYQVNYTHRLCGRYQPDPWSFFIRSMSVHGANYGAFINSNDWVVSSASPELFFKLDGNHIESCPMKGTAARGLTYEQDGECASELQMSEKNRSENLMIVDMVRNDIGRVAEVGSVSVSDLFKIEKYSTVWQMTSTVQGKTNATLSEIFSALFPPASITGAPKERAMQIIAELETTPRNIYTGTIGCIAPGGRAQFNVAIRTLLINKKNGQAEYGVGGGIVWDSDCLQEQDECRTKAQVLEAAPDDFDLLETILWEPESGFSLLERHLTRLYQSSLYFDFDIDLSEVRQRLVELSLRLPLYPHKIRLLVSRSGQIFCRADVFEYQNMNSSKLVALARSSVFKSNRFLYHKTTNRRVYQEALQAFTGIDDVILYNEDGEITESTIANVVIEVDGVLYTPPIRCGLLPGTYRAWMLDNKMVEERVITIDQIHRCSQLYLVNSVRGMYKVKLSGGL